MLQGLRLKRGIKNIIRFEACAAVGSLASDPNGARVSFPLIVNLNLSALCARARSIRALAGYHIYGLKNSILEEIER